MEEKATIETVKTGTHPHHIHTKVQINIRVYLYVYVLYISKYCPHKMGLQRETST